MTGAIRHFLLCGAFLAWGMAASHAESQIRAKVMWTQGSSSYSLMGEGFSSLSPMMSFPEGTVVRTEKSGQALLSVVPGVHLLVRPDSEVHMKQLGYYSRRTGFVYNVILEVKRGSVLAEVRGLMPPSRFRVQTAQGIFETSNGNMFVSYREGEGMVAIVGGQFKATLVNGKEFIILSSTALEIRGTSANLEANIVAVRYDELLEIQSLVGIIQKYSQIESNKKAEEDSSKMESEITNMTQILLNTPTYNDLLQAIYENGINTNNTPPNPPVSPVSGP